MQTLHLIKLSIDPKAIAQCVEIHGLQLKKETDLGYAMHVYLTSLFGDDAPKPFRVEPRRAELDRVVVLGYATKDASTLRTDAQAFADPRVWAGVDWEAFVSKPMPSVPTRRIMGFSVRVCPTIRRGDPHVVGSAQGTRWSESSGGVPTHEDDPGAEVDVYLAWGQTDGRYKGLSRESSYALWMRDWMERTYGKLITIESIDMVGFRLESVTRREPSKGVDRRKEVTFRKPSALLTGTVQTYDSECFQRFLSHGIGRHRSFGFGMVLLRRVEPCVRG
jgi:CRISPR system Cascade subunit CasE